ARDGSISGEHGIGIEKRDYMALMCSDAELSAQRDIKAVFDPRDVFNPGKMVPAGGGAQQPAPLPGNLPSGAIVPATTEEASRALAALSVARRNVRITGALPPDDDASWLSTARLRGVRAYALEDLYVTVGAGTPLEDLERFLAETKMQVALASPWPAASIGAVVAANVNAPWRMRYGGVRDQLLCATVVLADGRIIRAGRPVVKNVAGYDLARLFVGSHGTLGLIADVTLRVAPRPRCRRTVSVAVPDLAQGLAWAEAAERCALVASGIVIAPAAAAGVSGEGHRLVYTAEGLRADVTTELEEVGIALGHLGRPTVIDADVSATTAWIRFLAAPAELAMRVGVPSDRVPFYLTDIARALPDVRLFVDVPAGLVYTALPEGSPSNPGDVIERLRRPVAECGGYAVVL
ncbi:MAG: FAD-binding protein, partial [Planctomycetes bacterium]|nr:FAD-binding protein [Planctomycetota bacterium]